MRTNRIKSFLKKHRNTLFAGVGGVTAGALGVWLLTRNNQAAKLEQFAKSYPNQRTLLHILDIVKRETDNLEMYKDPGDTAIDGIAKRMREEIDQVMAAAPVVEHVPVSLGRYGCLANQVCSLRVQGISDKAILDGIVQKYAKPSTTET